MHLLRLFDRIFCHTLSILCVGLCVVMIAAVFGQVIMRYIFNAPLSWSEELARYAMVYLAMLATALCMRHGQHIALIDAVPLSPGTKRAVSLLAGAIVAVILFVAMWYATELSLRSARQRTPGLGLSMRDVYAAIPIGLGLSIIGLVLNALLSSRPGGETAGPATAAAPSGD